MKIKGFDKDLRCRGFQFEIGKEYQIKTDEPLVLCTDTVFHYCDSLQKVHVFYDVTNDNRFCEIEVLGDEVSDNEKYGSNHIKIVREIIGEELDSMLWKINNNSGIFNSGYSNLGDSNSGNWNSGNRNSGNWNSGNRNSGEWNSGNWNSGNRNSGDSNSGNWNSGNWNSGNSNSGDWNKCNNETGHFNTKNTTFINVFNKRCKVEVWYSAKKPDFIYFDSVKWVGENNMTDQEKRDNPYYQIAGGYLKTLGYKEAWRESWNSAKEKNNWGEQYQMLLNLPNFNKKIFKKISGIDVDKDK